MKTKFTRLFTVIAILITVSLTSCSEENSLTGADIDIPGDGKENKDLVMTEKSLEREVKDHDMMSCLEAFSTIESYEIIDGEKKTYSDKAILCNGNDFQQTSIGKLQKGTKPELGDLTKLSDLDPLVENNKEGTVLVTTKRTTGIINAGGGSIINYRDSTATAKWTRGNKNVSFDDYKRNTQFVDKSSLREVVAEFDTTDEDGKPIKATTWAFDVKTDAEATDYKSGDTTYVATVMVNYQLVSEPVGPVDPEFVSQSKTKEWIDQLSVDYNSYVAVIEITEVYSDGSTKVVTLNETGSLMDRTSGDKSSSQDKDGITLGSVNPVNGTEGKFSTLKNVLTMNLDKGTLVNEFTMGAENLSVEHRGETFTFPKPKMAHSSTGVSFKNKEENETFTKYNHLVKDEITYSWTNEAGASQNASKSLALINSVIVDKEEECGEEKETLVSKTETIEKGQTTLNVEYSYANDCGKTKDNVKGSGTKTWSLSSPTVASSYGVHGFDKSESLGAKEATAIFTFADGTKVTRTFKSTYDNKITVKVGDENRDYTLSEGKFIRYEYSVSAPQEVEVNGKKYSRLTFTDKAIYRVGDKEFAAETSSFTRDLEIPSKNWENKWGEVENVWVSKSIIMDGKNTNFNEITLVKMTNGGFYYTVNKGQVKEKANSVLQNASDLNLVESICFVGNKEELCDVIVADKYWSYQNLERKGGDYNPFHLVPTEKEELNGGWRIPSKSEFNKETGKLEVTYNGSTQVLDLGFTLK